MSAHVQIIDLDFNSIKNKLEVHKAILENKYLFIGVKITPGYIWSNFNDKEQINKFSKIEITFLHNAFCFYKRDTLNEYPMPEKFFERRQILGKRD